MLSRPNKTAVNYSATSRGLSLPPSCYKEAGGWWVWPLARIFHHPTAATADPLAVTGCTPCESLDVVSTTPATPSLSDSAPAPLESPGRTSCPSAHRSYPAIRPCTPSQRRLNALASRGDEKSGIGLFCRVEWSILDISNRLSKRHYDFPPAFRSRIFNLYVFIS